MIDELFSIQKQQRSVDIEQKMCKSLRTIHDLKSESDALSKHIIHIKEEIDTLNGKYQHLIFLDENDINDENRPARTQFIQDQKSIIQRRIIPFNTELERNIIRLSEIWDSIRIHKDYLNKYETMQDEILFNSYNDID